MGIVGIVVLVAAVAAADGCYYSDDSDYGFVPDDSGFDSDRAAGSVAGGSHPKLAAAGPAVEAARLAGLNSGAVVLRTSCGGTSKNLSAKATIARYRAVDSIVIGITTEP